MLMQNNSEDTAQANAHMLHFLLKVKNIGSHNCQYYLQNVFENKDHLLSYFREKIMETIHSLCVLLGIYGKTIFLLRSQFEPMVVK